MISRILLTAVLMLSLMFSTNLQAERPPVPDQVAEDLERAKARIHNNGIDRCLSSGVGIATNASERTHLTRPLPKSSGAGLKGRVLQDGVRDVIGASNGSAIRSSADLA